MPPSAQTVTPSSSVGANSTVLSADAAAHDEDRSDRSELVERSEPSEDMERGERAENGHHSPESALEAYTERLNIARVRAEFEGTLMTMVTLNVLYMYYVDHSLIILFIRASQVARLLYLPYASDVTLRSTSLLVWLSNLAVVFIHGAMVLQHESPGRMLFINFIGPEPKSPFKIIFLDALIIILEVLIVQCRLDSADRMILTMAPVPAPRASADAADASSTGENSDDQLSDGEQPSTP